MPARRALSLLALAAPGAALAAEDGGAAAVRQLAGIVRWGGVVTSVVVVFAVWLALRFLGRFVARLGAQFPAQRLTIQKAGTILQFTAYVLTAVMVVVLSLRLDERALAVLGGTAAVSIGFALKDLVASFIAGIMIVVDRPFQVGDRVTFGGEYGDIVAIGLRSVRLRTLGDNLVTIPNSKFLSDITSSGNYGALDMQVAVPFHVGLDQDVDAAREVIHEAALTSRYVHLPKPVTVLVQQVLTENFVAVKLVLKAYVLDTQYEKAFETDVNLRVLRAFRERGILPPAALVRSPEPQAAPG
jgi:small-conductance mechanosensitive channel